MEPDLIQLREQLRRFRALTHDDLQSMLAKMKRECQALVQVVEFLKPESEEPIDLEQIKGVTKTLGNSVEALVSAIQAGTFRDFGGPEQLLDELISTGRQPSADELNTIIAALDVAMQ